MSHLGRQPALRENTLFVRLGNKSRMCICSAPGKYEDRSLALVAH